MSHLSSRALLYKIKRYKIIILHPVLYKRENLFLFLREEHSTRVRIFETEVSVPRRTSGTKRQEETRSWKKLHDDELHSSHPSPNTDMVRG
jgi:hypothetical protein